MSVIISLGAADLREARVSCRVLFGTRWVLCVQGQEGDGAFILILGEADVTIEGAGGEGAGGEGACGVTAAAQLKANDAVGELTIARDLSAGAATKSEN